MKLVALVVFWSQSGNPQSCERPFRGHVITHHCAIYCHTCATQKKSIQGYMAIHIVIQNVTLKETRKSSQRAIFNTLPCNTIPFSFYIAMHFYILHFTLRRPFLHLRTLYHSPVPFPRNDGNGDEEDINLKTKTMLIKLTRLTM